MKIHLALVLLLIPSLLGAGILAGPERAVAPAPIADMFGGQPAAVVASAGPDSLVAFFDQNRQSIYISTLSADGVASVPPRRVAQTQNSGLALCWTGRAYLLHYTTDAGVMQLALNRDGTPLRPAELIARNGTNLFHGLAWNGHHALAVWAPRFDAAYFGMLLDAEGALVRSSVTIPTSPSTGAPFIVASGDIFCVLTLASTSVPLTSLPVTPLSTPPPPSKAVAKTYMARIDDRGEPLDAAAVLVETAGAVYQWAAAADAHSVAIVEAELQPSAVLRRIVVNTQTLAPRELPALPIYANTIEVAATGGRFVALAFTAGTPSALRSVTFEDDATPRTLSVSGTYALQFSSAFNGHDLVVTWSGAEVRAFMLDPAGVTVTHDATLISAAPATQRAPALAPGAVVWREPLDDSSGDVFASFDGGPRVRVSASGFSSIYGWAPSVAFTGSMYMIVWDEYDGHTQTSWMRRYSAGGRPIDAAPVSLGTAYGPTVAFNGTTFLVVFSNNVNLLGRRFDRDGNALDDITIAAGGFNERVASNGEDFLVVWSVGSDWWQYPSPNMVDVMAARVSASGQVLDPTPITVTATKEDEIAPRVASNGRDYLVAWSVAGSQVVAQRVQANGTLDGAPLTIASDLGYAWPGIALAGDPGGYWISWDNNRETSVTLTRLDNTNTLADPVVVRAALTPALLATGTESAVWAYARDVQDVTMQIVTRALGRGRRRTAVR